MMSVINIKNLVIAGDAYCGKTSLLKEFTQGKFLTENVTTVSEQYVANVLVDGKLVQLILWDTPGEHYYDRIRTEIYQDCDVILLSFSIDHEVSFRNIEEIWYHEVHECCPKVPIILVGNKKDLRNDENVIKDWKTFNKPPITMEEGQAMADKIKAYAYIECSAKTNDGVNTVFQLAARAALQLDGKKKSRTKFCALM